MSELAIFVSGLALGAIITAVMLVLFGQWLFASGAVFMNDNLYGLSDSESQLVQEQRVRDAWMPGRVVEKVRIRRRVS